MVALFLDDNKTNDDDDCKDYINKQQLNNFARASRYFVHFLAAVARLRRETS